MKDEISQDKDDAFGAHLETSSVGPAKDMQPYRVEESHRVHCPLIANDRKEIDSKTCELH